MCECAREGGREGGRERERERERGFMNQFCLIQIESPLTLFCNFSFPSVMCNKSRLIEIEREREVRYDFVDRLVSHDQCMRQG